MEDGWCGIENNTLQTHDPWDFTVYHTTSDKVPLPASVFSSAKKINFETVVKTKGENLKKWFPESSGAEQLRGPGRDRILGDNLGEQEAAPMKPQSPLHTLAPGATKKTITYRKDHPSYRGVPVT